MQRYFFCQKSKEYNFIFNSKHITLTSNGGENKQQKWLVFRLRQLLYTPEEFELLLRRRARVSFSNGKKKKEGKEKKKEKNENEKG